MRQTRRHARSPSPCRCSSLAIAGAAQAADDYPNKPIKLILPAAAGGPTDVPARIASQILQRQARPAGGGREPPRRRRRARRARGRDAPRPTAIRCWSATPACWRSFRRCRPAPGYDPVKNFVPIVRMTESFQILVVNADSPWKTLKEFVDDCKANPGKINYAHTGAGGLPHLVGELFMLRSGCKMTGVPYRSGGELVTGGAVQGGRHHHRGHRNHPQPHPRRQAARARRAEQDPHAAAARHADHGRGRRCRAPRPTPSTGWWRRPARRRPSSRSSTRR